MIKRFYSKLLETLKVKPCTFFDKVKVGDQFRLKPFYGTIEEEYHILSLEEDTVHYQHKLYGYSVEPPKILTKAEFKVLVKGGVHLEGWDY